MSIRLTPKETKIASKLAQVKNQSGSHSPSFSTTLESVPEVNVKLDCCFLSNPYATDLFLDFFHKDLVRGGRLRSFMEYYPPQNRALGANLARYLKVPKEKIFVGNGATEIIQAILHNFVKRKILVCIPTFSPYIEFAKEGVEVVFHKLKKENNFRLSNEALVKDVRRENPDAVVIINPNNPDGGYLPRGELSSLLESIQSVPLVILDESFIHFADSRKIESTVSLVKKYSNLVIIKSLSKDFGVAGLRVGYAVMEEGRVNQLLKHGYLWNVSGFGEYFLSLLSKNDFMKKYERVRARFIKERDDFYEKLSKIRKIKVYPSKANFFLVELLDGSNSEDFVIRLLVRYGIYTRSCKDKVGLSGEFIRVASRSREENKYVAESIAKAFL